MKPPPNSNTRVDRGTAARSGASDLALFAATPIAFASTAHADALNVHIRPASPSGANGGEAVVDHDVSTGAALGTTALIASPQPHTAHVASSTDTHQNGERPVAASHDLHIAHGSSVATYVPAPHHEFVAPFQSSGAHASLANSQAGAIDHAAATPSAAAASATMPAEIAQALDTIKASAASLSGAIAALNDHLPSTAEALDQTVGDTLGAAQTVVDTALDHVGTLGTAAVDALGSTAGTLASTTGTVADDVAAAATGTLDDATHVAGAVLDGAAHVADAGVSAVTDVLQDVTSGSPIGGATHLVDTGASAVADTLHDFTGADPAGGVTTLVGLVSAADAFNIHDDGAGSDAGLSPAMGVSGAVDMLADLHPADVLLGANDHHGSALGGLLHDDGHLLGLG